MTEFELTQPEYLMLCLLAEIDAPIALDGEAIEQLRFGGLVQDLDGGVIITEPGRRRADEPFRGTR